MNRISSLEPTPRSGSVGRLVGLYVCLCVNQLSDFHSKVPETPARSDPWYLWPLRHLIRVMRRRDLTIKQIQIHKYSLWKHPPHWLLFYHGLWVGICRVFVAQKHMTWQDLWQHSVVVLVVAANTDLVGAASVDKCKPRDGRGRALQCLAGYYHINDGHLLDTKNK